jgi:hypothetical protein
MILENGVGTNDDSLRVRVLRQTIQHLARSMQNGVEVRGYFHWSILDNIEWGFGNTVRFGLIRVDPHHSLQRTLQKECSSILKNREGQFNRHSKLGQHRCAVSLDIADTVSYLAYTTHRSVACDLLTLC